MKEFKVREGSYLKDNNSTTKMMYTTLIILSIFVLFSSFKNGIYPLVKGYGNLYTVFKPLILTVVASLSCLIFEYIYYLIKGDKKSIYDLFALEFAVLPGMIISLIIPINTPPYLVVIASIITSLYKVLNGGFASNKINLTLIGGLLIIIIMPLDSYLNLYEKSIFSDSVASSLNAYGSEITYSALVRPFGNLFNYLIGIIPGSNGATCNLLVILCFFYLVYKKQIKWEIILSSVLSVIIISLVICLFKNIGLWFILYNLLSGSFLFSMTFLASDFITSPITKTSKIIYGILIAVITMIIRYSTSLSGDIYIAIFVVNIFMILFHYLNIIRYK